MENEKLSLDEKLQQLTSQQSLTRGIVVGLIAAIVAVAIWSAITYVLGDMLMMLGVLGVGISVGLGVRFGGKGIDLDFGIAGGIIALISIFIGDVLGVTILMAREKGMSIFDVISLNGIDGIIQFSIEILDWGTIIFQCIFAFIVAYYTSVNRIK